MSAAPAIVFDSALRTLSNGERSVRLSQTEAMLFEALFREPRVVTFGELISELYPDRPEPQWSNTVLKVMLFRIRSKARKAGIGVSVRSVRNTGHIAETAVDIRRAA